MKVSNELIKILEKFETENGKIDKILVEAIKKIQRIEERT